MCTSIKYIIYIKFIATTRVCGPAMGVLEYDIVNYIEYSKTSVIFPTGCI